MKRLLLFVIVILFLIPVSAWAQRTDYFLRGIIYWLLEDQELAKKNLNEHFRTNPQRDIGAGFDLLLEGKRWDSAKQFNRYLESSSRMRFQEALVGISLALNNMEGNATFENLNKALRLSPNNVPAMLCLGYEYWRKRNYPEAERYLSRVASESTLPEAKIWLARIFIETDQPQKAVELIRPHADANPGLFHLNHILLQAFTALKRFDLVDQYADRALRAVPNSNEILLIKAKALKYLSDWKGAKAILEKLKFENYNLDYSLCTAEVLIKLNDSRAEKWLREAFKQHQWDPLLNRLFAMFAAKKHPSDLPHWIRRALLAGNDREQLKREIGSGLQYPDYNHLPLFEVKKLEWVSKDLLLAAGKSRSGDRESVFLIGTQPFGILKSFPYEGAILDFYFSPDRDRILFSTTNLQNDRISLYYLRNVNSVFSLAKITSSPILISNLLSAYSSDGYEFYFTDTNLPILAFESPFSLPGQLGKRTPVYPKFPQPIYKYTFMNRSITTIKNNAEMRRVPIKAVQKYFMVADAIRASDEIRKLIELGQTLEISSNEFIKIHFSDDLSEMIVQKADLKNAFQAHLIQRGGKTVTRFDEWMFLGNKVYAELTLLRFDPKTQEIYVLTKDKEKKLIRFNYSSLLYDKLSGKIVDFHFWEDEKRIFFIYEKKNRVYYSENYMETILLDPYKRDKFNSRSDFERILPGTMRRSGRPLFTTYNGEIITQEENDPRFFTHFHVDFTSEPYGISHDFSQVAVFINGRLFLLPWDR